MTTGVVTKCILSTTFGNDGFVRVRKRSLKPGPYSRKYAKSSASYDLVRAVRVNGKPRHQFVIGFGSQKNTDHSSRIVWFWVHALLRMKRHGLVEERRYSLALEMVRKKARLPTARQCEQHVEWLDRNETEIHEIKTWLKRTRA